jgi:hypothetical protein
VVADAGFPIQGAQVTILGTRLGGISDVAGHFRIVDVPFGRRTLEIRYVGFDTRTRSLTVTSGVSKTDITLFATAVPIAGRGLDVPGIGLRETATRLIRDLLREPDIQDVVESRFDRKRKVMVWAPWLTQDSVQIPRRSVLRVSRDCPTCMSSTSVTLEGGRYYTAADEHIRLGVTSSNGGEALTFCLAMPRAGEDLMTTCAWGQSAVTVRYVRSSKGVWVRDAS